MEKQIQDLTDIELKALAYDQIIQIQLYQNNLNILTAEINKRIQKNQKNISNTKSDTNNQ